MYSSTFSLASALDGVSGQHHAPAALPRGKRPGTHCIGGCVGPRGRSGRMRKVSPPPEFDPRTAVQNTWLQLPTTPAER
jgi:hypothetical protein